MKPRQQNQLIFTDENFGDFIRATNKVLLKMENSALKTYVISQIFPHYTLLFYLCAVLGAQV